MRRFVAEGARVVVGDRNSELLDEVAAELGDAVVTEVVDVTVEADIERLVGRATETFGSLDVAVNCAGLGSFSPIADHPADEWRTVIDVCLTGVFLSVKHEADIERLVGRATETFGSLDVAVNCAGLGSFSPIADHPADEWRTVIDVCLTGVFLSVKHEAQAMRAGGTGGVIVNIASINAKVPAVGLGAYCCAKAGVEMLTRCAGMELGPEGIRVAGIGPGYVETPLTAFAQQIPALHDAYVESIPLGRAGAADDIASAALFLVSDDASWVTGETLYVDGAESTKGYPDFTKLAG